MKQAYGNSLGYSIYDLNTPISRIHTEYYNNIKFSHLDLESSLIKQLSSIMCFRKHLAIYKLQSFRLFFQKKTKRFLHTKKTIFQSKLDGGEPTLYEVKANVKQLVGRLRAWKLAQV